MDDFTLYALIFLAVITCTIVFILVYLLIDKNKQLNHAKIILKEVHESFEHLDDQAKLIIKTDLELNKAQEQLDLRLSGLDTLQKISRLVSTTLDEDEIFHRLKLVFNTNLNFEKIIIFTFTQNDPEKSIKSQIHFGVSQDDMRFIIAHLNQGHVLLEKCQQGNSFSSINCPQQLNEKITQIFHVHHFIIAPIFTQNGMIGIVFVGNQASTASITAGDEELIAILANQIGQAIENARLFEQIYRSRQELEKNVHDRTQELELALNEVQKISKTKTEFISAVSHELRTPLTSIKGYASLLMTGKLGEIPDSVKERLGKINTHSDNLVTLINNLLDISRIESGRVPMNITSCNLTHIIENVYDLLTPQFKDKQLHFKTNIPKELPDIPIDSSQVERIFINLIGNAIKFTPDSGTIYVDINFDSMQTTTTISDTGIGISETDLKCLFDEFYRVENTINQNVKGTGLGLPLAKKIVEAHKGQMWVTSKLNEGTTFHFTLPLAQEKINPEEPKK